MFSGLVFCSTTVKIVLCCTCPSIYLFICLSISGSTPAEFVPKKEDRTDDGSPKRKQNTKAKRLRSGNDSRNQQQSSNSGSIRFFEKAPLGVGQCLYPRHPSLRGLFQPMMHHAPTYRPVVVDAHLTSVFPLVCSCSAGWRLR